MKKTFLIILLILISACSAINKHNPTKANHLIAQVVMVYNNKEVNISELQFYKINSAKDTMKMMYENFGRWNQKSKGKYQDNLNQVVWKNKNLLNDERKFSIIADGTETQANYFASIIVLDSNGKDCLNDKHPLKNAIVDILLEKMNNLSSDSSAYKLF